ncbi:MAG: ATP-binding protein [Desulfarculaceae bacterium]|nr:ATP-binding protein [Desulfarculaceae bacterium]
MAEKLHFIVNAELKSVIGKDLINNDNIAVLELVKNAYDAGSDKVKIYFNNTKSAEKESGFITIVDYGCGMDLNDIKEKWLNIAYSEKKEEKLKDGRRMAGNKGVGRFSCDRLGSRLDMYTLRQGGECIHLPIEWREFENSAKNKEIGHVALEYEIVPIALLKKLAENSQFKHGTILKITKLESEWGEDKLIKLKRELEKFINPHQAVDLQSFDIRLICPEYADSDSKKERSQRINGPVLNSIYDDLIERTSSIHSRIDKEGEHITTTLYHRGEELFTIIEENDYKSVLKDIEIHVMYLNQYDKALFTRRMGYQVLSFGSVFLFLHGFRVSPYGERNNDWLGLDNRKQQGYARYLGTREIFGRIEINDETPGRWRIISNREGIVNNEAFESLTDPTDGFFYRVFKKLEKYVIQGLGWDTLMMTDKELEERLVNQKWIVKSELPYRKEEKEKEKDVLSFIQDIIVAGGTKQANIQAFEFDSSLVKMLANQEKDAIADFFKKFQTFIEKSENPKDILENISKLRNMLEEEKDLVAKYRKERDEAREKAKKYQEEKKEAEQKAKSAEDTAHKAQYQAQKYEEENLFLKAEASQDLEDVVDMHHQIIAWAESISKDCRRALKNLKDTHAIKNEDKTVKAIENIEEQIRRIIQLASFATKKNLRLNAEPRKGDLLGFISEYLDHKHELKPIKLIKTHNMLNSDKNKYMSYFKPLEMTILVDNIVKNSKKASAKNIFIEIEKCEKNKLTIIFDDDGKGLDKEIINASDIFKRGFTTTDGSGIGLYHSMNTAKEMGGTLEVVESKRGGMALRFTVIRK